MAEINGNSSEKNISGECIPYRISTNESYGLHMVASRNLPSGTVILLEKPLMVGPLPYSSPICLGCNDNIEESTMSRCPRCHWPLCSEECSDSKLHAEECHILSKDVDKIWVPKNLEPTACNGLIMILRCLLLRSSNPEIFINILSMVSNVRSENRKQDPDDNLCDIVEYLESCGFENDVVCEVDGVLNSNGVTIKSNRGVNIFALYKLHRIINHSCVPNVQLTSLQGDVLEIRTTMDISENQQIFATYLETTVPLWERTIGLKTHYCFDCTCFRCADSTEIGTHYSSASCFNCPDKFLIPKHDLEELHWKCNSCDATQTLGEAKAKMNKLLEETETWDNPSPEEILSLLNKTEKIFHSHHYIWMKIADIGLRYLRRMEATTKGHLLQSELLTHLLEVYNVFEPGLTRRRAFIHKRCIIIKQQKSQYENCEDIILPNALYRARESVNMFTDAAVILMLEQETSRSAKLGSIAKQKLQVAQDLLESIRCR
ncbi:unnamed protein product, partial [Meganyctiphanes norvegica]